MCFLYELIYLTVVIFPYYKWWTELGTLKLVLLRLQQDDYILCTMKPQNRAIKNCSKRQLNARQLTPLFLCSFSMRCYLNILFLRFKGYLWIFMAIYKFPFLKHFLFERTLARTDVKLYHRKNAPTSGSFTAETSKDFPFTWSVEAI